MINQGKILFIKNKNHDSFGNCAERTNTSTSYLG